MRDYLLSGMVGCVCGTAMVASSEGRSGGKKYFYYRCNSYDKATGRSFCGNKKIPAIDLEHTVWEFIRELTIDPQTTLALYSQSQSSDVSQVDEKIRMMVAIEELQAENKEELKRLNWMFQKKRCDVQYYEVEHDRLTRDYEGLEREKDKAKRALHKQEATIRQLDELEDIGRDIRHNGKNASYEKKRHILERLRTHVTIERTASPRQIIIEVLGYRRRVGLKNASARRDVFETYTEETVLTFRLPLLHAV